MSLLLFRPTGGTAVAPVDGPLYPEVPRVYARIAWRSDALTMLPWDGSSTAGWTATISGPVTSLASTSSDTFGGGSSLDLVTAGTAASGVDYGFGTATFVAAREYTFRVGLRNVSGSAETVLRLGTAADYAAATATVTSEWDW